MNKLFPNIEPSRSFRQKLRKEVLAYASHELRARKLRFFWPISLSSAALAALVLALVLPNNNISDSNPNNIATSASEAPSILAANNSKTEEPTNSLPSENVAINSETASIDDLKSELDSLAIEISEDEDLTDAINFNEL